MSEYEYLKNWRWWACLPLSLPFAFWYVACKRGGPSLLSGVLKFNEAGKRLYYRAANINKEPTP